MNNYHFKIRDFISPRAIKAQSTDIRYHLVLLVGASNTTGKGLTKNAKLDYTNPRVLEYSPVGSLANQLVLADNPLSHIVTDSTANEIGYAMAFARAFIQYLPFSDSVVLLPCGTVGLGMAEGNSGSGFGSTHYNTTITHVNNALANIPNSELRCILSIPHGGNDPAMNDTLYQSAIDATFNGYRSQITKASKVPIGVAGYTPQSKIDTPARATKENIFFGMATRLANRQVFIMNNQTGLTHNTGDTVHFDAPSQRLIGQRLFGILRNVLVG